MSAAVQPDFPRIHDLLAECVRADPGNILYLDELVANLQCWQPKRSWLSRILGGLTKTGPRAFGWDNDVPGTPYPVLSTEYALLQSAPDVLQSRFKDAATLRQLAAAADACDYGEVELFYWKMALEAAPTDLDSFHGLARALTRQGRFEQAYPAWKQLLTIAPGDVEARTALADLDPQPDQKFEDEVRRLADAQAAGGPLLMLLGQREALQLARAQHRVRIAQRRAAADSHPKSARLVEHLAAEHARLEIEMLHLRCERLPGDWRVRVDLAKRLKAAGNYSGAIQRLEEAGRIEPGVAAVAIELGENWQRLRQFAKALEFYRQAIAVASDEDLKLALYRGGTLAAAMGQPDEARGHLTRLIGIDAAYRDARERLDKLPRN